MCIAIACNVQWCTVPGAMYSGAPSRVPGVVAVNGGIEWVLTPSQLAVAAVCVRPRAILSFNAHEESNLAYRELNDTAH